MQTKYLAPLLVAVTAVGCGMGDSGDPTTAKPLASYTTDTDGGVDSSTDYNTDYSANDYTSSQTDTTDSLATNTTGGCTPEMCSGVCDAYGVCQPSTTEATGFYDVIAVSARVTPDGRKYCALGLDTCDLYVLGIIGQQEARSPVAYNQYFPQWNAVLFKGISAQTLIDSLRLQLFDSSMVGGYNAPSLPIGACTPIITPEVLAAGTLTVQCYGTMESVYAAQFDVTFRRVN